MLGVVQWVLKGFAFSTAQAGVPWLLREYEVDGPRMQLYTSILLLPWAIKPIFGLVSDFFPVCGYGKLPYMVVVSCLATVGFGALAAAPPGWLRLDVAVLCLAVGHVQMSLVDLLTEAVYSTKIRANPERGSDLVTFVWMGVFAGSFIATASAGPVLEHFGVRVLFGLCLGPAALVLLPTCLNFHGEEKKTREDIQAHRERYLAQPELIVLVLIMTGSTLILATASMLRVPISHTLVVAVVILLVVLGSFLLLTKPLLGLLNAFHMLQSALSITIEGGAFYFFTNNRQAYPEGPHFSKVFYTTGIGLVASVFSMLGMVVYKAFCKDCRYRCLFYAGNILTIAIHTAGVLVFTRYNLVLGIPDEVFMIGTVMINAVITQALWLPTMLIISHMCPKNMEATVFALVAGCGNLGRSISEIFGASLLKSLGVTPNGSVGESAKFDHLWVAALIAALAPVVTIGLIPIMVPNARQDEKLLDDAASAVEGSPWKRLQAGLRSRAKGGEDLEETAPLTKLGESQESTPLVLSGNPQSVS